MIPTETLESPPRSGHATAMTFIVHNPDGSEKKRIAITSKTLIKVVLAAALGLTMLFEGPPALEQMQHRKAAAELRPTMEKLSNEGQEAASLWLVKNYFSENKQRMTALVEAGNVEAMYVQGRIDISNGRVDSGNHLIAAAAAKGFAPAIQNIRPKD